jgi:hypothetical protein
MQLDGGACPSWIPWDQENYLRIDRSVNIAEISGSLSKPPPTCKIGETLFQNDIKVNSAHPGWVKTELGTQHTQMEITDGAKTSV